MLDVKLGVSGTAISRTGLAGTTGGAPWLFRFLWLFTFFGLFKLF